MQHGTNQLQLQLRSDKQSFADITPRVAAYFGIPDPQVFFSLRGSDQGPILLKDMRILDALFPLKSACRSDATPRCFVVLQRNKSHIENLLNLDEDRQLSQKLQSQNQKLEAQKRQRQKQKTLVEEEQRQFELKKKRILRKNAL